MLIGRLRVHRNIWQICKQTTNASLKRDVSPFRLVALAGTTTLSSTVVIQLLTARKVLCSAAIARTHDDPWLLVPIEKFPDKTATRSFLKNLLFIPISVSTSLYWMIRMTLRFVALSLRFAPLMISYPIMSRFENTYNLWWRFLLWNVQASGPTLIKLGQWASTRRDVFSKEFCDKLSILHTKTKKRRLFRDCDKVLVDVLGPSILKHKDDVFLDIQPYSIGSGCIAQVYKAKLDVTAFEKATSIQLPSLREKQIVDIAIKVADKRVEEQIEMDLSILHRLASFVQFIVPNVKYLDPLGAIEQFEMVLRRQVDLRNEAKALTKFAENFDPIKTGIRFPIVIAYNQHCIVETFEDGMYINRLVAEDLTENDIQQSKAVRRRIALLGARALLKMIFVDNFVHGDLHPGNILVRFNDNEAPGVHHAPLSNSPIERMIDWLRGVFRLRDSPRLFFTDSPDLNDEPTLILLDTGIAISETPENLKNLKRIFRCIVEKRGYKAGELFIQESPNQECKEPERFCREVETLIAKARSERSLRTLNISALMSELFNIVSEHRVQLDSAFTSILLSIMVLEGFGRSLDPDLDLFTCARPYLLNVML